MTQTKSGVRQPSPCTSSCTHRGGGLGAQGSAEYLGKKNARFMDDLDIPKCDLAKAGTNRPIWVWRIHDLEEYLAKRWLPHGEPSPWSNSSLSPGASK
jgi:hypothetical protein